MTNISEKDIKLVHLSSGLMSFQYLTKLVHLSSLVSVQYLTKLVHLPENNNIYIYISNL
jgi:hypothetical protein